MTTFTQIESIGFGRLNTAEYLNFMYRYLDLLPGSGGDVPIIESPPAVPPLLRTATEGLPALNITEAQVTEMNDLLAKLTDLTKQSHAEDTTAEKIEIDKARDTVAAYILDRVFRSTTLPIVAEQEAGKRLYNTATPYKGVGRLPVNQETEAIKGMLVDFAKPEVAAAVVTLGLQPYLDELERLNNHFVELVAQQGAVRSDNSLTEDSRDLRRQTDKIYEAMIVQANASHVLMPSETSTDFVRDVNSLIAEARTSRNLRKTSSPKPNEDKPDIET